MKKIVILFFFLSQSIFAGSGKVVTPSKKVLDYQKAEMNGFIHLSLNQYSGRLIGKGDEDPSIFNPIHLDTDQWASVFSRAGMKTMILTTKHHDGFSLWNTKYSDHQVMSSPFKKDIVKMAAESAKKYKMKFGVYYSMYDAYHPDFGTEKYNKFVDNQLRELLTNYGEIAQVWLDGHIPKDVRKSMGKDFKFPLKRWVDLIKKFQPNAIHPNDTMLLGHENGIVPNNIFYNQGGRWRAAEAVTTTRYFMGKYAAFWFPMKGLSLPFLRSKRRMRNLYYTSVGRGAVLLLNISPNRKGLFPELDSDRVLYLGDYIRKTFKTNLAKTADVSGSYTGEHIPRNVLDGNDTTYWVPQEKKGTLTFSFPKKVTFDIVMLKEEIQKGQKIKSYKIEYHNGRKWKTLSKGTAIGVKKLYRKPFGKVRTKKIRLHLEGDLPPSLSHFGLYLEK
tara:strand:+ start:2262 stop:3596 length:1335 start_codon:yes stop_codon:yes gene_type:complete